MKAPADAVRGGFECVKNLVEFRRWVGEREKVLPIQMGRTFSRFLPPYSAGAMASMGQVAAQEPQSMQVPASIII